MQIDTELGVLTLETPDVMAAIHHYCEEVLGVKLEIDEADGRKTPVVVDAEFEDNEKSFSVEFDLQISENQGQIALDVGQQTQA